MAARVRALVEGAWHPHLEPGDPALARLRERPSKYRTWITPDGGLGPAGQPAKKAETGRYHLYVSYACPWAHRAILYRRLKGLEDVISMSVLHPRMAGEHSWSFVDSQHSTDDHLYGVKHLYEIYRRGDPAATTVVTVPMLWDRETESIVNRESGDIIRILERSFNAWAAPEVDFRPGGYTEAIEQMNQFVLQRICSAVYRVGFAESQLQYNEEVANFFSALDEVEWRLSLQPYLLGEQITEPDWHLFCTLVRMDAAYHCALRCSRFRLIDYPALSAFTRRLYEHSGVAETVDFEAIRLHYFDNHPEIDPTITPATPGIDFRTQAGAIY